MTPSHLFNGFCFLLKKIMAIIAPTKNTKQPSDLVN